MKKTKKSADAIDTRDLILMLDVLERKRESTRKTSLQPSNPLLRTQPGNM